MARDTAQARWSRHKGMEFWEASRLVVEMYSGPNVSNSCAR